MNWPILIESWASFKRDEFLAKYVTPTEIVSMVRKWLGEERLFVKEQPDGRAHAHILIKYPQGKQGHMFAVVIPKNRDLIAISSMTRVDKGQQEEMKNHMKDDNDGADCSYGTQAPHISFDAMNNSFGAVGYSSMRLA